MNPTLPDPITRIVNHAQSYLRSESGWEVLIEFGIIWIACFVVVNFLRGTRGARALQGLVLILLAPLILLAFTGNEHLERLGFLLKGLLLAVGIGTLIIFQPELRRAMVRLGEAHLLSRHRLPRTQAVRELTAAVAWLARNRVGALVAIERRVGLGGVVNEGVPLNAEISHQLLCSIFLPGSPLHDMGVIVRGDKAVAASVQFPLSESGSLPQEYGSRHRAALGLSEEGDALVVVVSEETGHISLCERGQMHIFPDAAALEAALLGALGLSSRNSPQPEKNTVTQTPEPENNPDSDAAPARATDAPTLATEEVPA